MKQYPVYVPSNPYRGSDPRKRRKAQEYGRVAGLIEQAINGRVAQWKDDTMGTIMSYEIANEIGEDSKLVHSIIFRIDGGSNGVTIWKGDYERALAVGVAARNNVRPD